MHPFTKYNRMAMSTSYKRLLIQVDIFLPNSIIKVIVYLFAVYLQTLKKLSTRVAGPPLVKGHRYSFLVVYEGYLRLLIW